MAQVTVQIGGRSYALACRDGDEAHLEALAGDLASRAERLTGSLGQMTEARLLLMSALMVADELHDIRQGRTPPAPPVDPAVAQRLKSLVERAEQLAERLGA